MNRTLRALTILLSLGLGSIVISLALFKLNPSLGETGIAVGLGILGATIAGLLVLSLLLVAWEGLQWLGRVPRTLRRTQMRITDLVLLVALLGNGAGLSFRYLGDASPAAAIVVTVVWSAWVLLAATWMLWVARRLEEQGGIRRAYYLFIGWATPLGLLAILGGPGVALFMLLSLPEGNERLEYLIGLGLSVLAIALGFWIINEAIHLYQDATRGAEGSDNDGTSAISDQRSESATTE